MLVRSVLIGFVSGRIPVRQHSGAPHDQEPVMKKLAMFAAAFALATGAFWSVILTDPPTSAAAVPSSAPVKAAPGEIFTQFGVAP